MNFVILRQFLRVTSILTALLQGILVTGCAPRFWNSSIPLLIQNRKKPTGSSCFGSPVWGKLVPGHSMSKIKHRSQGPAWSAQLIGGAIRLQSPRDRITHALAHRDHRDFFVGLSHQPPMDCSSCSLGTASAMHNTIALCVGGPCKLARPQTMTPLLVRKIGRPIVRLSVVG